MGTARGPTDQSQSSRANHHRRARTAGPGARRTERAGAGLWIAAIGGGCLVFAGGALTSCSDQPQVERAEVREHDVTHAALAPEDIHRLYITHCAACHGADGRGDGPAAERLYPQPRDFRESPFRFAGGTEVEVLRTIESEIRRGMPRSGMPGFGGVLTEGEIAALARYVGDMSRTDDRRLGADDPLRVGRAPPFNEWLIADGARLYRQHACHTCHGDTGRGDGPATETLVDSLGKPVRPGDLASGLFKAGGRPEDLYRAIVEGVPGTPMPGYGPMLIDERETGERHDRRVWALVAYIKSLTPTPRVEGKSSGASLHVQELSDESMLYNPSDPRWVGVDRTVVAVRPLWQRIDETISLSIAAVRAGDYIGVYLSWADETPDVDIDSSVFPDSVAVMFGMGDKVPALPMGVDVEGHMPAAPVNVWHWKAHRQYDAAMGGPPEPGQRRELPEGNYHVLGITDALARDGRDGKGTDDRFPPVDADLFLDDPLFNPAQFTGNVRADASLVDRPSLEANAEGFGTLTYQPSDQQDLRSTAVWANGRWFVHIFRKAETGQELDIGFSPGRRIPVAFAVWDGARGDRDGVKRISGWHWLEVEPDTAQ